MRCVMLAVAVAVLPVPALAQDRPDDARHIAEEMKNPVTQAAVAATAQAMADVLLQMPVGPLMRAGAEMAGQDPGAIDPNARVVDMMGPQAARAPQEFAAQVPAMMGAVADMSDAIEAMLPRLAEIGQRVRQSFPPRQ